MYQLSATTELKLTFYYTEKFPVSKNYFTKLDQRLANCDDFALASCVLPTDFALPLRWIYELVETRIAKNCNVPRRKPRFVRVSRFSGLFEHARRRVANSKLQSLRHAKAATHAWPRTHHYIAAWIPRLIGRSAAMRRDGFKSGRI